MANKMRQKHYRLKESMKTTTIALGSTLSLRRVYNIHIGSKFLKYIYGIVICKVKRMFSQTRILTWRKSRKSNESNNDYKSRNLISCFSMHFHFLINVYPLFIHSASIDIENLTKVKKLYLSRFYWFTTKIMVLVKAMSRVNKNSWFICGT